MVKIAAFLVLAVLLSPSSRARAAEDSPRVVLLDAVVLPPALEKTELRSKVLETVSAAARAHGWEPVSIATDCHDLGCAGAAARSTKAVYALVLVGRFAANDTYASDVGVALWRDGAVVATRTEEDEEAEQAKGGGGKVVRCGPPDGTCTAPLLTSKLEQYAVRLLEAETAAMKARAAAATAAVVPAIPVPVSPVPAVPVAPSDEHPGQRALGWSLVGAGVLLGGGAVALWAFNGSTTQCNAVPGDLDDCRAERKTGTAALVTGGVGLAAIVGGLVVLLVDRAPSRVALSVHPSGFSVGGTF